MATQLEQNPTKDRHHFTNDEKAAFNAAYSGMSMSIVECYDGLSLVEARTIVQAYCHCRNLPTCVRPALASFRLAFDTLEAKARCKKNTPPDSVATLRNLNCEKDPDSLDVDEYDQYELFQEIQGQQPYWDKCQWLKDPLHCFTEY